MIDASVLSVIITTVGAILLSYMKYSGNRRERILVDNSTNKDSAYEAQVEFIKELVSTLVRMEQKQDVLHDMHIDPRSTFSTVETEKLLKELIVSARDAGLVLNTIKTLVGSRE